MIPDPTTPFLWPCAHTRPSRPHSPASPAQVHCPGLGLHSLCPLCAQAAGSSHHLQAPRASAQPPACCSPHMAFCPPSATSSSVSLSHTLLPTPYSEDTCLSSGIPRGGHELGFRPPWRRQQWHKHLLAQSPAPCPVFPSVQP